MALVIAGLYQMAVTNFGHPDRFNTVPKTLSVSVFTTAGVYCIVPVSKHVEVSGGKELTRTTVIAVHGLPN